ncbi:MAG: hypothetical protein Q4G03_10745 [Planctomycetia bacterium]|nr:hypothetical protein [Planctomycetia bacterium]
MPNAPDVYNPSPTLRTRLCCERPDVGMGRIVARDNLSVCQGKLETVGKVSEGGDDVITLADR